MLPYRPAVGTGVLACNGLHGEDLLQKFKARLGGDHGASLHEYMEVTREAHETRKTRSACFGRWCACGRGRGGGAKER